MLYTSQKKKKKWVPTSPETQNWNSDCGWWFGTKREENKNIEDKLIELWILTVIFYIF